MVKGEAISHQLTSRNLIMHMGLLKKEIEVVKKRRLLRFKTPQEGKVVLALATTMCLLISSQPWNNMTWTRDINNRLRRTSIRTVGPTCHPISMEKEIIANSSNSKTNLSSDSRKIKGMVGRSNHINNSNNKNPYFKEDTSSNNLLHLINVLHKGKAINSNSNSNLMGFPQINKSKKCQSLDKELMLVGIVVPQLISHQWEFKTPLVERAVYHFSDKNVKSLLSDYDWPINLIISKIHILCMNTWVRQWLNN